MEKLEKMMLKMAIAFILLVGTPLTVVAFKMTPENPEFTEERVINSAESTLGAKVIKIVETPRYNHDDEIAYVVETNIQIVNDYINVVLEDKDGGLSYDNVSKLTENKQKYYYSALENAE